MAHSIMTGNRSLDVYFQIGKAVCFKVIRAFKRVSKILSIQDSRTFMRALKPIGEYHIRACPQKSLH